jgi:hypothetical protein
LLLCEVYVTDRGRRYKFEWSGKWEKGDEKEEWEKKFRRGYFGVAQSPKQSSGGTEFILSTGVRIARELLKKRRKNLGGTIRGCQLSRSYS